MASQQRPLEVGQINLTDRDMYAEQIYRMSGTDAMLHCEMFAHGNAHSKRHRFENEAPANPSRLSLTAANPSQSNDLASKGAVNVLTNQQNKHVIVSQINQQ
jgi:hypothetical protein